MKFGVQLYSLRDYICEHGLEHAFRAVSDAGFEGVEFAGFYGKSLQEIQELLNEYSLAAVSAHVGAAELESQIPYLKGLGIECAVIPYIDFNGTVSFESGLETLRCAEKICEQNGLKLAYHNHSHEFKNGTDIVGRLTEYMPSLKLEPDAFWLTVAGIDAANYMRAHADRLIYLHIKEYGNSAEGSNPVIGEGNAKLDKVLRLGKELDLSWSILEIEKTDLPMEEYLKRSYAFMKKYQ